MTTETTKKRRSKAKSEEGFISRQRNEALKTLSDIVRVLQTSKKEDNPLGSIVRMVRKAMKVDVCSLYMLQNKKLVLVATDGLDPSAVGRVKMPLDKGLTGLIAETGKPLIANDAQNHPRFEYFPETKEERFDSFAGVPILQGDKPVGVMTLQTQKARKFSDETTDLLSVISFQLSSVIHNLVTLEAFRHKSKSKKPRPLQYAGLAASPGIAVGSPFILRNKLRLGVPKSRPSDPKIELGRIRLALKEASKDLVKLEKQLLKKLSRQESDIFNAHRMILKDRSFQQKINKEIQKKCSAEEAIVNVIGDYLSTFSKIKDPYLQDRAIDMEDLAQRLLKKLSGDEEQRQNLDIEGILFAEGLTPSETALLDPDKIQGIVTVHGGSTSHAAILARSLGIPAIMGVPQEVLDTIKSNELIIVDGNSGNLFINPPPAVLEEYEKLQQKQADRLIELNPLADNKAITKDGHLIHLEANVGLVDSLQYLKYYGAEGVGLYRTEFPFMVQDTLPTEDQQYEVYRRILEMADGLPVTFRTLDAGGDKPISYLHLGTDDSFLGYRSIRLCLSEPHILVTQLKALFRAASHGKMRILFPMISGIEELLEVKKLIRAVKQELRKRKGKMRIPDVPIGIMIEVPSAVQLAHLLIKEVDFFSVGTNDLIQFLLAVDRNNEKVAKFFEPLHPAVVNSLWQVVQATHREGKSISICGEMAGDPSMTTLLVGLGFDRLSMIPANIPLVKRVVRNLHYKNLTEDIEHILEMPTAKAVKHCLAPHQPKIP